MLILYLACLIFGGLLLAMSLMTGGDHSTGHGSLDAHTDAGHSLSGHGIHNAGLVHDAGNTSHSIEAHHHTSQESDAVKFFSFRNGIYFLSFFGLTGTIMQLTGTAAVIGLLSSLAIGSVAAVTGYKFMAYLSGSESGNAVNIRDFIGREAKVALNLSKERKGQICIMVGGQVYEMVARAAENSMKDSFVKGDSALVIDIEDNIAYIIEYDSDQDRIADGN